MATLLWTMLTTALVLAALRPGLLRLSASALLLYPPYYLAVLTVTAAISPGFVSIWGGDSLWGPRLLGFPLEETVFVCLFAVTFPLVAGTILGTTVARPGPRPRLA